ncbi:unnamed protein product [Staurois parvus]|uniref:Uncharacterized protein n=1 Tax=Staurois parvus TaxID=386267 RepID=A0ABN9DFZ8_9NEOB|nr:unnamed protein product [Staurois parvus]
MGSERKSLQNEGIPGCHLISVSPLEDFLLFGDNLKFWIFFHFQCRDGLTTHGAPGQ